MHPDSRKRTFWTLLCLIFVLYDVVMVPVYACFDPEESPFVVTLNWVSACFWLLDILVTFLTAVYIHGVLHRNLFIIACKYVRGWFAFDCIIVVLVG